MKNTGLLFQEMKDIEDSRKQGKRKKHQGEDNEEDDTEQSAGVRKRIKGKHKGKGKWNKK